jgi:hypothetical protein
LQSGAVVRVDNANAVITSTIIRAAGGGAVSCIDVDPANENHLLVTYSAYGVSSVFETTTGAAPWTNDDGGDPLLPDMPIRWCMFDPRNGDWALLATEKGIWSTDNLNGAATDWQPTNNNFANTRVDMLQYRASDGLLLAATHGRGLFSAFIPAAATPVTLLNFTGRLDRNDVQLHWETATEQNSEAFEIERSYDGIQFLKIARVAAAGNSTSIQSYSYHDLGISQERNYYRLKQIDLDGKYEYSRIIMIRNPILNKSPIQVLNNPFGNTIDLQLGNIYKGRADFRLFDMNGRILYRQSQEVTPSTRIRLHLPAGAASGIYNFEMILNGKRYITKLVKK